jgi:Zn-dependent peptidase ImmA (M78 family)/transcriptional regulator with XRE-family HTH domain
LGIDRSALARVEGGQRHVSALELFALADAFRLPLIHFVSTPLPAVASHREDLAEDADLVSRDRFRLDAWLEAHARDAEWLRERGFLCPPVVRLPDPSPLRSESATEEDAREAARGLRRELGLAGPLGSMADILASAGLFALVLPDLQAGASLLLDEGFGVTVIGGNDDPGRRRMTAAHELGHFTLQDEYQTDIGVVASRDAREQRINAFAIEFLVPSDEFEREARSEGGGTEREHLIRLAAKYRVSWTVCVKAAQRLGVVDSEAAQQLRAKNPQRGEFLEVVGREPGADLKPGETSGAWRQAVIAAWKAGEITAARAVELLHEAIAEADLPDQDVSVRP